MGRREKRRFRAPLCGQSARTAAWTRSGPGPSQGRCHCGSRNSRTASGQASQFHHSDRHDSRWRSIGERARCQSGATRRQRHGDEPHGAGPGREAAGIAERGSARLARVAVLWNAANPYSALVFKETQAAGRTLGIEVQSLEVRAPDDFDGAFEAARRQRPDALITVEDPLTVTYRQRVADFTAEQQLPSLHGVREFAAAGGLMSYGASLADLFQRAAGYVDKILRGAKPADLPVQQPSKFELVINLKTAKALGLTVPLTLQASADEVIE